MFRTKRKAQIDCVKMIYAFSLIMLFAQFDGFKSADSGKIRNFGHLLGLKCHGIILIVKYFQI